MWSNLARVQTFSNLCKFSIKANLEKNKESLSADLVCLLDVQSMPQDVAELKKLFEQFFIYGGTRIDLIAQVMDLDNELAGLYSDIPLLERTEEALTTLTQPAGNKGQIRVLLRTI